MQPQQNEVTPQLWLDALAEFGQREYKSVIEMQIFSVRGVRVLESAKYRLLNTEGLLYEVLNWVGEVNPEVKVRRLHEFLENRGLIDSSGQIVRWSEKVTVVGSTGNVSA